jgi:glutamine---fructose-6-phosphate transaminase (isomerizing)
MCGIVGYIGKREVLPILIKGLKRLEYRGYDSAGVAVIDKDLQIYKKAGKVNDLEELLANQQVKANIGMGHTRWATHGPPNDKNAHPHFSQSKNLAIIHNGIIENYASIKEALSKRGYTFVSDTDTEVLVQLIEDIKTNAKVELEEAVRLALNEVIGAYAIVVISKDNPDEIIAARKGSPMVLGIGKDEYFIASDASPIIEYTNKVIYLEDFQMTIVNRNGYQIKDIHNEVFTPYVHELEMNLEMIEKGGYEHFMMKEIFEQPRSVHDSMRGRINAAEGTLTLSGAKEYEDRFMKAKRIIIVACGTSWHAGLVAEYLIEELARIPVEVEYASEFRYRNPIINEDDVIIAISQSGETADTLAALELAKSKGALIYGICNVVGSSISRITHAGSYTHAGPEIGVASTKAFTAQVTLLTILALDYAQKRGKISRVELRNLLTELEYIPSKIEQVLELNDFTKELAQKFYQANNCLYLGRGINFPVALEGALKLKEISYIHAEGYPAAEMKHGPIALIDKNMPVVVIATADKNYEKVVSNIQEVKARSGVVIAIVNEGNKEIRSLADYVIEVPQTHELLSPLINTIPLQLLSYHIALLRGCNVDQPRNLAKSVTVE